MYRPYNASTPRNTQMHYVTFDFDEVSSNINSEHRLTDCAQCEAVYQMYLFTFNISVVGVTDDVA